MSTLSAYDGCVPIVNMRFINKTTEQSCT
ncbi:hypothetical protein CBM2633_B60384 [Cupriavidus taiwanensis]|nr:hypothetical protein CBM2633_B60384 [Cupriavidus taiwanensis]